MSALLINYTIQVTKDYQVVESLLLPGQDGADSCILLDKNNIRHTVTPWNDDVRANKERTHTRYTNAWNAITVAFIISTLTYIVFAKLASVALITFIGFATVSIWRKKLETEFFQQKFYQVKKEWDAKFTGLAEFRAVYPYVFPNEAANIPNTYAQSFADANQSLEEYATSNRLTDPRVLRATAQDFVNRKFSQPHSPLIINSILDFLDRTRVMQAAINLAEQPPAAHRLPRQRNGIPHARRV